MKIELTKEEIRIITDSLLSEMNRLNDYRGNRFVNQTDLENYINKVHNLFKMLIDKE